MTNETKEKISKSMKKFHETKKQMEHLDFLLDHFEKKEILETFAGIDEKLQERK